MNAAERLRKVRAYIESQIERAKQPSADPFNLTSLTYCAGMALKSPEEEHFVLIALHAICEENFTTTFDVFTPKEALHLTELALLHEGDRQAQLRSLGFEPFAELSGWVGQQNGDPWFVVYTSGDPPVSMTQASDDTGSFWYFKGDATKELELFRFMNANKLSSHQIAPFTEIPLLALA